LVALEALPRGLSGGSGLVFAHAASALLLKRRFPVVSLLPLLIAVQAVELQSAKAP
jgi:hypothetical protein